jgi:general L-amino acid transport system ATP-binding protein
MSLRSIRATIQLTHMVLMDAGQIVELNEPKAFFEHPQHERTRLFLSQILR